MPGQSKCGGCYYITYCGREHQKKDWSFHKKVCRKVVKFKGSSAAVRAVVAAAQQENSSKCPSKDRLSFVVSPQVEIRQSGSDKGLL